MEKARKIEDLLGDMERWTRNLDWMEELLRRWRVREWRESQEEKERIREEERGRQDVERKKKERMKDERRRKKKEKISDREKRKEEEIIGVEIKNTGEKGDRCPAGKVQEKDRERKVGEGRVYMMEKRLGEAIERRGNEEEGEERSQGRGELQKCFGREGRSEESGGS